MRTTVIDVISDISKQLKGGSNGPAVEFAEYIGAALDKIVEMLARLEEHLSEKDKDSVSVSIDIITAAVTFVARSKIDKKDALDFILDGFYVSLASRAYDLPSLNISDENLEEKIAICKGLAKIEHWHISEQNKNKKEKAKIEEETYDAITDEILKKLKRTH